MPAPPVFKQVSSSIDDTYMDEEYEDDPPENKKTLFPMKHGVNKQVPQKSPHFKKETIHFILL